MYLFLGGAANVALIGQLDTPDSGYPENESIRPSSDASSVDNPNLAQAEAQDHLSGSSSRVFFSNLSSIFMELEIYLFLFTSTMIEFNIRFPTWIELEPWHTGL